MDEQNKQERRKYVFTITPERREELRQERLANMRRGIDAAKAKAAAEAEKKDSNDQA